jgi:NAD-dependent deacetylase
VRKRQGATRSPPRPDLRPGRTRQTDSVTTDEPVAQLSRLIVENQPCVVLTGAGVSTESGVPDFRSPTGIWAQFDPLEYGTLGAFRSDPSKVWRFYAPRFDMLMEAEPNRGHLALAELEVRELVRAVITQNIDLLHERAGSRELVEVHGSIRTSSCPGCGARYELREVVPLIEAGEGAPACPACAAILKPDVVFFDELLPPEAIDRAYELAEEARLLLVVGSSLEVYPVAELPRMTLDAGGKVAVLNRTPTWVDGRAALTLDGSAGEVLRATLAHLRPPRPPVVIADYDPEWPRLYDEEAARIREALGDSVIELEHMGSTAVPGLAGKPVIDISVGLRTLDLGGEHITALEELGYECLGELGLPGRLYFRKGSAISTHHVHAVEWDSEHWHRAFRDYLRAHPKEAWRYGESKRRLAAEVGHDWYGYVERKNAVADELFQRAWSWYGHG